ncbi:MAG: hypothetical protein CVV20_05630, partial [Gemmatimonadetes bacterium HGW-Gemmatimonadetes-1]
PAAQRAALEQLIATLDPAVLALPDTVIRLLPPVPGALADPVEGFRSRTTPMFDELGAARSLAQHTVDNILQRERLARLVAMAARDGSALTVAQVIDRLVAATWGGGDDSPYRATLRRIAARAVIDRLLELAADRNADQQVRDIVEWKLDEIGRRAAAALPVNMTIILSLALLWLLLQTAMGNQAPTAAADKFLNSAWLCVDNS